MKERFETYKFTRAVKTRISLAQQVLDEYQSAGYTLTIRQLYYQLVARGYIENSQRSYKRIVADMTKARMAGLVPWTAIEDRTRSTMRPPEWDNHVELLRAVKDSLRLPRWEGQEHHVEVFIEKEALSGVFHPLVRELHINITANRGYSSASEMWRHAKRLAYIHDLGQEIHILYFGDHDPSGMDMDRDIEDRLMTLSWHTPFTFQRLALTWDQIEEYNPPPNPAKLTDSRSDGYISQYGMESWELDALEPQVLAGLVRDAVLEWRDDGQYESVLEVEEMMKDRIQVHIDHETDDWYDVFGDIWDRGPDID